VVCVVFYSVSIPLILIVQVLDFYLSFEVALKSKWLCSGLRSGAARVAFISSNLRRKG